MCLVGSFLFPTLHTPPIPVFPFPGEQQGSLSLSLQCIIKPRHAASLPNGHRNMAGESKEELAPTSPIPAVPFVFSWILKIADDKSCTQRASPRQRYAAASSFLHPGERLPLVCGLREHFLQRGAGFRARTCACSQWSVSEACY